MLLKNVLTFFLLLLLLRPLPDLNAPIGISSLFLLSRAVMGANVYGVVAAVAFVAAGIIYEYN